MRTSWMVIVNPKAGMGHGLRDWPIISNQLNRSGVEFTCVFTERKYHAVELTVSAIKAGYRKIVAIGGDGTVNEVVNGIFIQKLIPTTEVYLAVIPVGTGNDWVRMFGIPKQYNESVLAIKNELTVLQDVGIITYMETLVRHTRYMANMAGVGFDAIANRFFNKMKEEGKKGRWLYAIGSLKALLTYQTKRFVVQIDGKEMFDGQMFSASIGIGPYNGGGMHPSPAAIFDDGLFDITLIKKLSKWWILTGIRKLYNGQIYTHPKVIAAQGKSIEVTSFPPSPIEIDGEALGFSPFTFNIVPQSIAVVVTKSFYEAQAHRTM